MDSSSKASKSRAEACLSGTIVIPVPACLEPETDSQKQINISMSILAQARSASERFQELPPGTVFH
ncbi:MAG: hypothetical protein R3D26_20445 [Cyanobacteriota/Melainabacteria group bacterium]